MHTRPLIRFIAVSIALTALAGTSATAREIGLTAFLDGAQANDGAGTGSQGTGAAVISFDDSTREIRWEISWEGLTGTATAMHFHGPAPRGQGAGVTVPVGVDSNPATGSATLTAAQADDLLAGLWYVNLHTSTSPGGEIRGQVERNVAHYWPLDEDEGSDVPDVAGGADGFAEIGADWVEDDDRGQVMEFDGVDGYASLGEETLPEIMLDTDYTWAFWANTYQTANNNVIFGNRYDPFGVDWAPREFIKFTTTQFEFHHDDIGENIDYGDIPLNQWVHHAVVKTGAALTYFRNGLITGTGAVTEGLLNPQPLYLGGDQFAENWAGRIDDVAVWSHALPASSVEGLADGTYTPDSAPLVTIVETPQLPEVFRDDFSAGLANWEASDRGLENNAPAGYDPPSTDAGQLMLGGITDSQFWYGNSIESKAVYPTAAEAEIMVDRVSLDGFGTAWRSSLWVLGDDGHYLHFSQNVGETGWSFNARDDGGSGTNAPTGSGVNIAGLDDLDDDPGSFSMGIRTIPGNESGKVTIQMLVDGEVVAANAFSNFPAGFTIVLTGQARAGGDEVSAVFDNVVVRQEMIENLPPSFESTVTDAPDATRDVAYSFDVSGLASDPEDDPITFSKVSGPEWASVSEAGIIEGTPGAPDVGLTTLTVEVRDLFGGTGRTQVRIPVMRPPGEPVPLWGWWPLNEGSGDVANDISGNERHGTIVEADFGGLGQDGSAWYDDPECGTVLSFNGEDGLGAYVIVGNLPDDGTLPVMSTGNGFSWSFWANSDQDPNNDIVLGNRYNELGADFSPREFIKFTTSRFEWHFNGAAQDIDYDDLPFGEWVHHVVVKAGTSLRYYRDGQLVNEGTISGAPNNPQPLFFAGQGVENWAGFLSDVRIFDGALTDEEVLEVFENKGGGGVTPGTRFEITRITRDPSDASIEIEWTSTPEATYAVEFKRELDEGWVELDDSVPSGGTTTTFPLPTGGVPDPAVETSIYLRVRKN